ncbi:MAG: adenylate kinase family protein [Candidatus Nanoarchaeia archaeon]|nr:adenylate kinase family protein [Candidatus Nanoarchaeia archaeon]
MSVIIITGTPGTGKTELALAIAKLLNYKYIDVNDVVKKEKLVESYDSRRKTNVVDEEKLSKALVKLIECKKEANLIIDSHMSQCIPAKHADLCIVTKCDLKILKKRLENKGYNADKVRENLDSEIFDVCLNEAFEAEHKLLIVDTSRKMPKELAKLLKNP